MAVLEKRLSWLRKGLALVAFACCAFAVVLPVRSQALPQYTHETVQGEGRVLVASAPYPARGLEPEVTSGFLEGLGISRLREAGLSGRGVTVGVVDTGVDPSRFAAGVVVDWIDLTAEGIVKTVGPYGMRSGTIEFKGLTLDVSGVLSRSGYVRVGEWSPSNLPRDSLLKDLLHGQRSLLVLVSDANVPGVYDTVYVDSNWDAAFFPSERLDLYAKSKSFLPVYGADDRSRGPLVMVLSAVKDNGKTVVLGFDGHGHGTEASSVLAGKEEGYASICPEVRILAIKAVDSTGLTTWELVSNGIRTAAERGADVILVSIAPQEASADSPEVSEALKRLAGRSLVIMAAGNAGPGLASLPQYAGAPGTVVVGGFVPMESQRMLGISLTEPLLWPWTSCGPNSSGATVDLVAPAVLAALLPAWNGREGKAYVFEGTSAAAACTAGVACLLTERARVLGLKDQLETVRRALIEGARLLKGVQAVEQGAGALDAGRAADLLPVLTGKADARITFKWNDGYQSGAFWDRSKTPGLVPFMLENLSPCPVFLNFEYPQWVRLKSDKTNIPAVDQLSSLVWFRPDLTPGLYSGFLVGDDPLHGGTELRALLTVVKPRGWSDSRAFATQALLEAGAIRREYFSIPYAVESLKVSLDVGTFADGRPRGRGSLIVYDPAGNCVYRGPWVGAGGNSLKSSCVVNLPSPGTWEVVIVSDPLSQLFGTAELLFKLSVSTSGMVCEGLESAETAAQKGRETESGISLQWRNSGRAFTGRVVLSDDAGSFLARKRIWVSRSIAAVERLPRLDGDMEYLYVSATNPADPTALIALYLYRYDEALKKWTEVASSSSRSDGQVAIFLRNPVPGDYVAYLEVTSSTGQGTYVQWTAAGGRSSSQWEVTCDGIPTGLVMWSESESKRLDVRPKNTDFYQNPSSLLLAIWDTATGTLKGLLPIRIGPQAQRPIVALLPGQAVGGLHFATLRAWDRASGKPVDACVCVGGVWYQLFRGEATFAAPAEDIDGPIQAVFKGITFSIQKSFSGSGLH